MSEMEEGLKGVVVSPPSIGEVIDGIGESEDRLGMDLGTDDGVPPVTVFDEEVGTANPLDDLDTDLGCSVSFPFSDDTSFPLLAAN